MKANFKSLILVASVLLFATTACDVITDPIKEGGIIKPPDSTTVLRKILIEDFTGHICKNCPEAAKQIKTLEGVYGEQIVGLGIHAGPSNFTGVTSDYPTDFRTPDGNQIGAFFFGSVSSIALPSGMISRKDYNGGTSHIKAYSSWPSECAKLVDSVAHISIKPTISYNATSRQVTVDVTVEALKAFLTDLKYVVLVTESGIVSPQLMPDDTRDTNYVHNHVLRDVFTQALGDELALSPITQGQVITKQITGTLDADWDENHCEIIVYVFNASNYEILQVEVGEVAP